MLIMGDLIDPKMRHIQYMRNKSSSSKNQIDSSSGGDYMASYADHVIGLRKENERELILSV